ncbi:MAG TPA: YciI family protein [Pseudonocardiaceae bacterium]|nr:YciI family protein [Pseudonocardiaceae bacterium]
MPRFLIIFRSHKDTFDTMASEQIQHFNQKWQDWWAKGTREGWLLDASKALKTEGRVINADNTISDGPLVEGADVVRGYMSVRADTLDAAVVLAKDCPVLQHGGRVEVRPFFETHPGE